LKPGISVYLCSLALGISGQDETHYSPSRFEHGGEFVVHEQPPAWAKSDAKALAALYATDAD